MIGARWRREKRIRAEAAAWLARIHSDDVSDSDIAVFRIWIDEDPRHQRAFASVTSLWEAVGGVNQPAAYFGLERTAKPRSLLSRRAMLVSAGTAGVIATIWNTTRSKPEPEVPALDSYVTRVGE